MRRKLSVALVVAVAAALAFPAAALAANAYGQTFAGQATCLTCHGDLAGRWQVGSYVDSAHGRFVTDVRSAPSSLEPTSGSKMWPSPAFGTGFNFGPDDIWLQLGAPGMPHEYVSGYANDASRTLSTGRELGPVAGPADDVWLYSITFDTHEGIWEVDAPAGQRAYFQSCAPCHFLGVTRPLNQSYVLGSGATADRSTETSYSGFGIQCEHCHGTGKAATGETKHWTSGVEIVRTKKALESQTCGQCHVNGTAKEKNYSGGNTSNANGYTPDRDFADFYNVAGVQYIQTSPDMPAPSIPATETKFYPSGHNEGMHHSYYNEWMLTGHARSLRYPNGELWSEEAEGSCLRCHSGEGFLKSINYGKDGPNDIGALPSSVASDTLDIECGICHTVHAKSGEPLGLRLQAEDLCGRCHNTLLPTDKPMAPGDVPHHPQREMREGYGLIGVSQPEERFMLDTECPDCHMPMTRETRLSHSFKVMNPGDAEEWGVQENGDSCTPCHTSRSREQLQHDLDGWETSLSHESALATAAIKAARSRKASTTSAGARLLAAARSNAEFVGADESHGAHNYPYALEGLRRAQDFARAVGATMSLSATRIDTSTGKAFLSGSLVLGDGVAGAAELVTIEKRLGGTSSWTRETAVVTGETGFFACAVSPKGTTEYRVRWTELDGKTAVVTSSARVIVGSTTSLLLSKSRIRSGVGVTISGAVSPSHQGAKVTIRYRRGTGSWRTLTTPTLSSTSRYSYTWRPYTRGRYSIRTSFGGDASHAGSISRAVTLDVY